jgi:hypothetical protein
MALAIPTQAGKETKGLLCLRKAKENAFLLDAEPEIAIAVIAGTGWDLAWFYTKPFFGFHPNDGKVPLDSARSTDAKETAVLPYGHDQLLRKPKTLKLVKSFIEKGTLYPA